VIRVAFKPTSTIGKEQHTVTRVSEEEEEDNDDDKEQQVEEEEEEQYE